MNVYSWLWIFLGSFATLVTPRLFNYLTRLTDPFPEDMFMLSQPLDWENVKATFDLDGARNDARGCPGSVSRRMLHCRFATCREYFRRMVHNTQLIELCTEVEKRDARRNPAPLLHEEILADARGMLEGAHSFEEDAGMAEYEGEADQLRASAAALRLEAQNLVARAEAIKKDDQAREFRIAGALHSAQQFRKTVRFQLVKLNLLSLLLRLDKLSLLPAEPVLQLWDKGNDELLRLYEQARVKAGAYISMYHQDRELLTRM